MSHLRIQICSIWIYCINLRLVEVDMRHNMNTAMTNHILNAFLGRRPKNKQRNIVVHQAAPNLTLSLLHILLSKFNNSYMEHALSYHRNITCLLAPSQALAHTSNNRSLASSLAVILLSADLSTRCSSPATSRSFIFSESCVVTFSFLR